MYPNLSAWGQTSVFFHELLHGVLYAERERHLPRELQKQGQQMGVNQRGIDHAWILVQQGILFREMGPPQVRNPNDEFAVGAAFDAVKLYDKGGWCSVLNYTKTLRH